MVIFVMADRVEVGNFFSFLGPLLRGGWSTCELGFLNREYIGSRQPSLFLCVLNSASELRDGFEFRLIIIAGFRESLHEANFFVKNCCSWSSVREGCSGSLKDSAGCLTAAARSVLTSRRFANLAEVLDRR